jgi:hypothetical protein
LRIRSGIEAARRAEYDLRDLGTKQWRRGRKAAHPSPWKLSFVHRRLENVALGAL